MPSKPARKNVTSRSHLADRTNCSKPNDDVLDVDPQRMALLSWLAKIVAHEIWNNVRNESKRNFHR